MIWTYRLSHRTDPWLAKKIWNRSPPFFAYNHVGLLPVQLFTPKRAISMKTMFKIYRNSISIDMHSNIARQMFVQWPSHLIFYYKLTLLLHHFFSLSGDIYSCFILHKDGTTAITSNLHQLTGCWSFKGLSALWTVCFICSFAF